MSTSKQIIKNLVELVKSAEIPTPTKKIGLKFEDLENTSLQFQRTVSSMSRMGLAKDNDNLLQAAFTGE